MKTQKGGGHGKEEKRRRGGTLFAALIVIAGAVVFLPFLFFAYAKFKRLQAEYLESPSAQRIVDLKHCLPFFIGACVVLLVGVGTTAGSISAGLDGRYSILWAFLGLPAGALTVYVGYLAAHHLAVIYFNVVGDKEKDILVFPFDMQSYTITDYFSLRFLHDFVAADAIAVSSIERLSRGHGKELYVHGAFGSRRTVFSSKQKRDEALAMVQAIQGKRSGLLNEIESY